VRPATAADRNGWVRLRVALWPDGSADEHGAEADRYLRGQSTNPLAVFVAEESGRGLVGFAEVSIRTYAEDCVTDRVGFLEGWFVEPAVRRRGVGRALVSATEDWARAQGCTEFASDAVADNELGAAAHRGLGFADAGLILCFRKDL
jgi:aminoglycoside 6'-N-acetyltransferase I